MISTSRRLGYLASRLFFDSSGMVLKVTLDDNRWDQGLTAVWLWWNTDVFGVGLIIRHTPNWSRDAKDELAPSGV